MRKFKVIEEGRLNKSQLSFVIGGGNLNCKSSGTIIFQQNGDGTVTCPISYKSCGSGNKITCSMKAGYNGQAGGAGLVDFGTIILP